MATLSRSSVGFNGICYFFDSDFVLVFDFDYGWFKNVHLKISKLATNVFPWSFFNEKLSKLPLSERHTKNKRFLVVEPLRSGVGGRLNTLNH